MACNLKVEPVFRQRIENDSYHSSSHSYGNGGSWLLRSRRYFLLYQITYAAKSLYKVVAQLFPQVMNMHFDRIAVDWRWCT
jgi:hypothetical protein